MYIKKNTVWVLMAGVLSLFFSIQSQAVQDDKQAKVKRKPMPIDVTQYTKRPPENKATVAEGRRLYENACIFCHGAKASGKGPVAYFLSRDTAPLPRDFTLGPYKFRSTESGEPPLDEDLFRTITKGIKGYMPGFTALSVADRWKLVYYIKSLIPEDFIDVEPVPIKVVGKPVPMTAMSVQRGYLLYQKAKCWECHGGGGEGNGEKAPKLKDDWDIPAPPANLTMPSSFKAGNRPEDLYRTILSGLDGGPMPSFQDQFEGHEQDIWDLINYIRSLSTL
ncbi:hypothetical protein MNBD_GAMMA21-1958 [hydrothermal vent metagenome]|uniref:Cytochrome c domain-containing protein n=1 Tax=hydrothermal vent metagenome TaxID=652676 RepID=A0A3B1B376_9ZZZZ